MQEDDFVKTSNLVYRILDFLPDSDPLKNLAKQKILAILEGQTFQRSSQVLDDIAVLESYLKIGLGQGWINNMNFLIITKEYHLIKASLLKEIPNHTTQRVPRITKDIVNNSVIQDRVKLKRSEERRV